MKSRHRRFAALASIAGALIAAAAIGGGMASSALARGDSSPAQTGLPAALSSTSTVVFSSVDRFAAESLGSAETTRAAGNRAARNNASPGGFTWEPAGTLSNARSRLGMAFFPGNGRFYVLGGESTGGNRAIPIEEYNPPRTLGEQVHAFTRCVEHRCGAGRQLHLRAGRIRRCRRAHHHAALRPGYGHRHGHGADADWELRARRGGPGDEDLRPRRSRRWVRGHDEPDLRHRDEHVVDRCGRADGSAVPGRSVGRDLRLPARRKHDRPEHRAALRPGRQHVDGAGDHAHRPRRAGASSTARTSGPSAVAGRATSRAPSRTTRPRTPGRRSVWPPAFARSARPSATTWP